MAKPIDISYDGDSHRSIIHCAHNDAVMAPIYYGVGELDRLHTHIGEYVLRTDMLRKCPMTPQPQQDRENELAKLIANELKDHWLVFSNPIDLENVTKEIEIIIRASPAPLTHRKPEDDKGNEGSIRVVSRGVEMTGPKPSNGCPKLRIGDQFQNGTPLEGGGIFWGTIQVVKRLTSDGKPVFRAKWGKVDKIAERWRIP